MFLIVPALLVAACGGSGGKSAGGTTVPPPGQPTSTASPKPDSPMSVKAKAAVFQATDFPPGFEAQPEEPGQGLALETLWSELTRCLGVDSGADRSGIATSPTFKQGLATQGRSTVEYASDASSATLTAALTGPKSQGCLMTVFAADLDRSKPDGGKPGAVKVTPRDVAPIGQKVLAWRINASVNLDELVVPLFQDLLVVFKGGAVIRTFFLSPGNEFPQTLERSLVEKVVGRA